jgi:hypothetical protein
MPFHPISARHVAVQLVDVGHDRFSVVVYIDGIFRGATQNSGSKEWAESVAKAVGSHDTFDDPCDLFVHGALGSSVNKSTLGNMI